MIQNEKQQTIRAQLNCLLFFSTQMAFLSAVFFYQNIALLENETDPHV